MLGTAGWHLDSATRKIQFKLRRLMRMPGHTSFRLAICNRPVVVSTSPVSRDRMPVTGKNLIQAENTGLLRCFHKSSAT